MQPSQPRHTQRQLQLRHERAPHCDPTGSGKSTAQQWHAACRTSSDLDVTRDKRRPDAKGKCDCGADREDTAHLYLECELYNEQRSDFLTELQKFQQAILAERKRAFGPAEELQPGEKEGLWMWIHTNRPAAMYPLLHNGKALRQTAMAFYKEALQARLNPQTRQVPGAPQTTIRAPQTQVPAIPASEHERLKRKRESFRQRSAKRARASRPPPSASK